MRSYPNLEDEYDQDELRRLQPEPWQLEQLHRNPEYPFWGPGEDYMGTKGTAGFHVSKIYEYWGDGAKNLGDQESERFGPWGLDELNEVVHFYFELSRENRDRHLGLPCKLGVVLWFLHPRKGCSRGVRVKEITQEQLPDVLAYLQEAAERSRQRFLGVAGPLRVDREARARERERRANGG